MSKYPKLERIPTVSMTEEEWVADRMNGIGGSEVAAALDVDNNYPKLKLYLNKIGEPGYQFEGNRYTESGKYYEDSMRDLYPFMPKYDPENDRDRIEAVENMFLRRKASMPYRKVRNVNAILINPKYPWLRVNVDGMAAEGAKRVLFEAKTTNIFVARQYEHGLNTGHFVQVMTYLMVTGWDEAHIFQAESFSSYYLNTVLPHAELFESIKNDTKEFWDRIQHAREIKKALGIDSYYGIAPEIIHKGDPARMRALATLQELEPEPGSTTAENKLLRSMMVETEEERPIPGNAEVLQSIKDYVKAGADEKKAKDQKTKAQNEIVSFMVRDQANRIEFPGAKPVSWKPNKNGDYRLTVPSELENYVIH